MVIKAQYDDQDFVYEFSVEKLFKQLNLDYSQSQIESAVKELIKQS